MKKVNSKVRYDLSANKCRSNCNILYNIFCVVFTENPISYIPFMIQGHFQNQKVNFKVR